MEHTTHPHYLAYRRMFAGLHTPKLLRMKQDYLDLSRDSVDPPELNEHYVFLSKVCDDMLEERWFDPA